MYRVGFLVGCLCISTKAHRTMLREPLIEDDEQTRDESIVESSSSANDDLKELCLLLDEERYKMHQLAEQWKHFGTSTIHKLECQIVDYQEKLTELEQRQDSLVKENQALKTLLERSPRKHVSTQTSTERHEASRETPIDDPLQQQISLQNMFDAIKTAEVYESIDNLTIDDAPGKTVLKDFCNLIWKYLEERSKPKSSCLL